MWKWILFLCLLGGVLWIFERHIKWFRKKEKDESADDE
jgi:hypothetical protein